MNILKEDTIAALATAPGQGAISIIRVSGPDSISLTSSIFSDETKLINSEANRIHYGRIKNAAGEVIDDVLISVFRAPNSYTGENSVEISTHGNHLIVKNILEELLTKSVRLAEPGEFTKRAFLNGKIDLAQAEAVVDIINSSTEASLRGARNQLDGLLSAQVNTLREMLVNASSLIELELDFAEEDLEFMSLDEVSKKVNSVIEEIDKLLATYSFGRVIKDGINVALVGKPNVGKSSLLNYILKESRAIVSSIPGTTRDVIREEVSIDGILFRLYDTAGIRLTEDSVEQEGVLRSRQAVKDADLVLLIDDVNEPKSEELFNDLLKLSGKERIVKVGNKIDINPSLKEKSEHDVYVSALTGEGISKLLNLIKEKSVGSFNYSEKTAVVSNLRHYNALKDAKGNLLKAIDSIEGKMSGEYISVDLRNAESSLGEIIGKVTTDDILNNIFSKFCIGK